MALTVTHPVEVAVEPVGGFARGWRGLRDVVLVAGGGTGGHLFPGLVLGREIARRTGAHVVVVGRNRPEEHQTALAYGLPHIGLEIQGMRRRFGLDNLRTMVRFAATLPAAGRIFRRLRPVLTIGMGGYASAPALLTARRFGVPILLHEQNAVPGRVTRWFAPWAECVCLTFPQAEGYIKGRTFMAGMPLRAGALARRDAQAYESLGLTPGLFTLVVTGGSQGARKLCQATLNLADTLGARAAGMQVLLLAGGRNMDLVRERELPPWLVAREFVADMGAVYGVADLMVARAGASTVAEITSNGLPSILVPLAIAADDHQRANARVLAAAGGCSILEERQLSVQSLADTVMALRHDDFRRQEMAECARTDMHIHAAERIAALAEKWVRCMPRRQGER